MTIHATKNHNALLTSLILIAGLLICVCIIAGADRLSQMVG